MLNNSPSELMTLESRVADFNATTLAARIGEALHRKRGFSLVRFGDGELRLIACESFTSDELYDQVLSYQFGLSIDILKARFHHRLAQENILAAVRELRECLLQQIPPADAVGIPCEDTLKGAIASNHEPSVRAFSCGLNSLSKHIRGDQLLLSTYLFSRDYAFSQKFFSDLFTINFKKIYLLTSNPEVPNLMKSNFNRDIHFVQTPSHSSYGNTVNRSSYPFFYDQISGIVSQFPPNSLVLAACGMIGKTVASVVKNHRSIFLDIGAIVDGWSGVGLPYIATQSQFRLR